MRGLVASLLAVTLAGVLASGVVTTSVGAVQTTEILIGNLAGGGVLDDVATPAEGDAQFSLSVRFYEGGRAEGQLTLRLDTGETYKLTAERGSIGPDGSNVQGPVLKWNFNTRCQGCGNPWLGDIAAASGFIPSMNFKLYSITGQPTPVGEAQSGDYKLQSGFIYSSQQ